MIIGTTPTFILKLKENYNIDFRNATNIYITLQQGSNRITKTGSSITIVDSRTLSIDLTESESLGFTIDKNISLQINWTYQVNGVTKRAATKAISIDLEKQLLKQAIT